MRIELTRTSQLRAGPLSGGRLQWADCAHNNAGIEGVRVPPHEYPEDTWDRVLAVNLKGIWLCIQARDPTWERLRVVAVRGESMRRGRGRCEVH